MHMLMKRQQQQHTSKYNDWEVRIKKRRRYLIHMLHANKYHMVMTQMDF